MNYYFTGILIIMLTLLAFCAGPAYPRNEYLNSYPNECRTGEIDLSISGRQYDYDNYDSSWNESNSQDVRLTFRSNKPFYRDEITGSSNPRLVKGIGDRTREFFDRFLRDSVVVSVHTRNIGSDL